MTVCLIDLFESIIPDNVSFTDFLKSPQSALLGKDQLTKSAMASPFLERGFWKGREEFDLGNHRNSNDEFMNMYQFNSKDDHKLTNMFATRTQASEEEKTVNHTVDGFKKVLNMNSPLLPNVITQPTKVYRQRLASDDEDDDVLSQKGTGKRKFNKGLKLLSVIVKDIVAERQFTTYKEVADIILKDTIKFENLNLNSKLEVAKEEQNIKRRVYDALNVLIAAGILVKEGKNVRRNGNSKKIIVNLKRLDANTLSSKLVS